MFCIHIQYMAISEGQTVVTGVLPSVSLLIYVVVLCYTISILIALLPFSLTLLYSSIFTLLPHFLSLPRPSLPHFLFCCWKRDILLLNTRLILCAHELKSAITNVCSHSKIPTDMHTHGHKLYTETQDKQK